MANVISSLLHSYDFHVLVNTLPNGQGFRLTGPGLLGREYVTSPALTARILASPEFDQLLGADKAQRILEMVLEAAAGSAG